MRHILLSGIVGSTAYGLAGPDSDVDKLAVGTYDTGAFFLLEDPPASVVSTKPDVTVHEARKAVKLLLGCNPAVTELLWLPERLYEVRTDLGEELVGIRHHFLSASRVYNAYLGYAEHQFHKLLERGDGSFSSDTRKRTQKHARHLARLVDQGLLLYQHGTLQVELKNPEWYLAFGEEVAAEPERARLFMEQAEKKFEEARSPLPEQPNRHLAHQWILHVRDHYYTPLERK